MKTKCFITGAITLTSFAIASVFYSCTKEDAQSNVANQEEFSKLIEVFDDCGNNSIVLKVSSDDKSIVDMYSADNFQLLINPFEDEAETPEDDAELDDENDEIDNFSKNDAIKVCIGVIETRFVEEVESYSLEKFQPEEYNDLRASWSNDYYFNPYYLGIKVKRSSINRRVYLSTRYAYKNYKTADSDIENNWIQGRLNDELIKNKKTLSDEACGFYYIGGIVRCKKHEQGKYSVTFYQPDPNSCERIEYMK